MDKYRDKVLTIVALAMEVSANTKADVFVRYSGHVDAFNVDIHPNGWRDQQPGNEYRCYDIYTKSDPEERTINVLDAIISDLNLLLKKEDA